MNYMLDQLPVVDIIPIEQMKVVSCTENLNSFCQIMYGQSMAELEWNFLGLLPPISHF